MNQIALRVTLGASGLVKTMRFNPDMSVEEVGLNIIEKTQVGDETFGLYQAGKLGVRKAKWLKKDKTLQSYDLKHGDELAWKSRQRPIKVKLMDGTVKTVMIDDSATIENLIELIGSKIGLAKTEEYGLLIEGADKYLNSTQSLQDQGVNENTILKFKKRYFVDDLNVDKSDPIQLHLVYLQSRDAILGGDYPVRLDEAHQFASIQLQVDHGNYDPAKHTEKWFVKESYLPVAHHKKASYKVIAKLWEKWANMNKINSYYRYVQTCRMLPTYGITTFEVKEKQEKQRKLVRMLLGITRDAVMRMDPETKEVIKSYPLEHVRRWAAAKTSFTLDFGTYEKDYYTVETSRGEEISQLLSGYIDILLKRRGDGTLTLAESDADVAEVEELGPLVAVPNVSTISMVGVGKYTADDFRDANLMPATHIGERGNVVDEEQQIQVDFSLPVQAARRLLAGLDDQVLLDGKAGIADPSRLRDDLLAAASRLGKAVSDMLGGIDGPADQININAMASADQLKQLLDAAKLAAASTNDQALLDAGRRVAEAVAKMLEASRDVTADPGNMEAKRALQDAISSLKGAAAYLQGSVNGLLTDPASEQLLLESAKQVADAIKRLAGNTTRYAAPLDMEGRKQLQALAQRAANAGQNVHESAKMLAPLVVDDSAKQQLISAARMAQADADLLLKSATAKLPEGDAQRLADAARAVAESVAQMMAACDTAGSRAAQNQEALTSAAKDIIKGLNDVKKSGGNQRGMDAGVRTVNGAVPRLLQAAKRAAMADPSNAAALLQSSKEVAGASKQFMGSAKPAIESPDDMEKFKRLLYAAQNLANATKNLLGDTNKFAVFTEVRSRAKECASACTAYSNTARRGIRDVSDKQGQLKLLEASDESSKAVQELVEALRAATLDPENLNVQARLVQCGKRVAKPLAGAVNVGRAVVPDVETVATKQALIFTTREAGNAISEFVAACNQAGAVTGEQDIDEAFEMLSQTQVELEGKILDADVGALKTKLSRDDAMAALSKNLQPLLAATAEMQEAHNVGKEAKRAAAAMQKVAESSTDVAASASGKDNQVAVIQGTKELLEPLRKLIKAARTADVGSDGSQASSLDDLKEIQDQVQEAVRGLLTATQKGTGAEECQQAADQVQAALSRLVLAPQYKPGDIITLSAEAESRAQSLGEVTRRLEAVVDNPSSSPEDLKGAAAAVSSEVPLLVNAINSITASCKNPNAQDALVRATQVMGGHVTEALRSAATARIDPAARERVHKENEEFNKARDQLHNALADATPGIAELQKASRMIADAVAMRDDLPAGDYNLQTLHAATNTLGDGAVGVIQSARLRPEDLGKQSVAAARAVSDVINGARGFSSAARAISAAQGVSRRAETMSNDPRDAIDSVKWIAQSVPRIIEAMKAASAKEDAATQKRMEEAQKRVGPALTKLLEAAKEVAQSKNVSGCKEAAAALGRDLQAYTNLSSDRAKMNGLLDAAVAMGNVTKGMVDNATRVARNPGDKPAIDAVTDGGKELGTEMSKFKELTKALSPGHADCVAAVEAATEHISELDKQAMAATVGLLEHVPDITHQAARERVVGINKKLSQVAGQVNDDVAADGWEALGATSLKLAAVVGELCVAAVDVAGSTTNQEFQSEHLALAKTAADGALQVLQINAALTTDTSSTNLKKSLKESVAQLQADISSLLASMHGGLEGLRACDEALEMIKQCEARLAKPPTKSDSHKGYAELQAQLIREGGEVAISGTQLFQTAKNDSEAVGEPSRKLASEVNEMTTAVLEAAASSTDANIRDALIASGKDVTAATSRLISASKTVAGDSQNQLLVDELSRAFQDVTGRVTGLIRAVKEGATGERDCREAIGLIRRTVADIDSCAVYAATGDYETQGAATLDKCYEEETKAAKDLAVAAGKLVASVTESQQVMGSAAKTYANTFIRFGDATKSLAGSTGDVVTQTELFGNTKALGAASHQLVVAAQKLQASPNDAAAKAALQEKAATVKSTLQDLIKGVNENLGPAVMGVKAFTEGQLEIIEALKAFGSTGAAAQKEPEDIVKALRSLKKANESLMVAPGTADASAKTDAATLVRSVIETLEASKGCFSIIPSKDERVKGDLARANAALAERVLKFLEISKSQRRDRDDVIDGIQGASAAVQESIQQVLEAARSVPGGEDLELEESKLEDKASQQLLAAAEMIKAAAAQLMNAPRRIKDPSADLDEQDIAADLLERARDITSSTYELLLASIDAQKEITSMGGTKKSASAYRADPAWAEGLISAAKEVAQTTQDLVSAANGTVKKTIGEEAVVATCRMVTGATARLSAASQAKLPLTSPNNDKLRICAAAVNNATKEIGTATKNALEFGLQTSASDLERLSQLNRIQLMKVEREETEKINKAQRDLEKAYRDLKLFRKKKYAGSDKKVASGVGAGKKAAAAAAAGGTKAAAAADEDDDDDDEPAQAPQAGAGPGAAAPQAGMKKAPKKGTGRGAKKVAPKAAQPGGRGRGGVVSPRAAE